VGNLELFKSAEFGSLRAVEINGEPWFVGKDVAEALGYSNPRKTIIDHVDDEDKGVTKCDTLGGVQDLTIINESGLYSLVMYSRLHSAKKFKRWVTSEVLPAIRKTGGYIDGQETMSDSELMAKALMVAQRTIEARNQLIEKQTAQIEEMTPKAVFADAVATSHAGIFISELAKLICQNGVSIGSKRLFAWMRDNCYLGKSGSNYNVPNQRYVESGLFEIKETAVTHSDGHITLNRTPKVTGKGQQYFINKFLGGGC